MTQRIEMFGALVLWTAGAALVVWVSPGIASVGSLEFFANPTLSLVVLSLAAFGTAALVLRPLWAVSRIPFAPSLVCGPQLSRRGHGMAVLASFAGLVARPARSRADGHLRSTLLASSPRCS